MYLLAAIVRNFLRGFAFVSMTSLLLAQQPLSVVPPQHNTQATAPKTFRVNTSLVLLDVVATDHHGNMVTDLKPEELRLLEDGKERPIKSMTLDRANSPERARMARQIKDTVTRLPKDVSTNLSALESAPDGIASTVLLMDALNTQWASRSYARQQMLALVKQLDAKQSVAVYGLTNSLRLLQDFTTDPAVLRAAIEKNGTQSALQGVSEGDLIDHSGSDAASDLLPDSMYQQVREFEAESSAQQLDYRVQRTLDALQSIARRLQSVPGRKNLIWLSGSFPLDLYPDNDYSSPWARHYAEELTAVLTVLENARIAIYPVDANGLIVDPTNGADRNPAGFSRRGGAAIGDASQQWRDQNASSQDTMKLVAEKTGGRAFFNRNDLKNAVQAAIDDGGTYYSLSFTPGNEVGDGKQHRLKLTTTRKGVELRYRRGYIAKDSDVPSKERVKFMQQELATALTDSQQISTGVVFYAKPAPDGKSIDLLVDANFLTFAHAENGHAQIQFQVATATFDRKGKVINSSADVVGKELKEEDVKRLMASGAHFKAPIERTEATKRVRVAVRDLATDRIGTVDVKLD